MLEWIGLLLVLVVVAVWMYIQYYNKIRVLENRIDEEEIRLGT